MKRRKDIAFDFMCGGSKGKITVSGEELIGEEMQGHIFVLSLVLPLFISWCMITETSGTFWFLSQVHVSAVGGGTNPALCDIIPGMSRRQRKLCQRYPDTMALVGEGAKLGISECQNQFKKDRWNCTTIDRSGFGKILVKLGSREAAFVYAVSSAGVVQSIAKACARGEIMSCSCEPGRRGADRDGAGELFSWGGCSDNIQYAGDFARRFIDGKEKKSRDGRALMNLHNNRAGRKTVKRKMRLQCKCHGVSGSCTTKTCWKAVPSFSSIGKLLHKRYRQAKQVTVRGQGAGLVSNNRALRYDSPLPQSKGDSRLKSVLSPGSSGKKAVKRSDLVFFEPSPDYCLTDPRTGSLGTGGRRCNKTSTGADSCELLCCGRGYDTRRVVKVEKCQCKFIWCCKVECKSCLVREDIHTCKGLTGVNQLTRKSTPPRIPPRSRQGSPRLSDSTILAENDRRTSKTSSERQFHEFGRRRLVTPGRFGDYRGSGRGNRRRRELASLTQ